MEIVREIRVDRLTSVCVNDAGFDVKISGLRDMLHEKKYGVRVKDIKMPYLWRNVEFDCYYGKSVSPEILTFKLSYTSMEDLCAQLSIVVNYTNMGDETQCSIVKSHHSAHLCDNLISDLVEFSVNCKRVVVKCGKGSKLHFSKNLSSLLGFENSSSVIDIEINDKTYDDFVGGLMIGKPVTMLGDHERLCHIVLDDINSRMICSYGHFSTLFSFNYVTWLSEDSECYDLFKTYVCTNDQLSFNFYNEKMMPYVFGTELNKLNFGFTLQFIKF